VIPQWFEGRLCKHRTEINHNAHIYEDCSLPAQLCNVISDTTELRLKYKEVDIPLSLALSYSFKAFQVNLEGKIYFHEVTLDYPLLLKELNLSLDYEFISRVNLNYSAALSLGIFTLKGYVKQGGYFTYRHRQPFTLSGNIKVEKQLNDRTSFFVKPSVGYKHIKYMTSEGDEFRERLNWTQHIFLYDINFGISKSISN